MKRLGEGIGDVLSRMNAGNESARKARRAAQIQSSLRVAVEKVYKDAAPFVLSHINGVYVSAEDGVACLTVYSDDSLVRSDIDARQEFLKMALLETGEHIESFRIVASRFGMKERHPYADAREKDDDMSNLFDKAERTPLSADDEAFVESKVEVVKDEKVRDALRRAMIAEFEYHGKKR